MGHVPMAFIQERLSTKARNILPILCQSLEIVLITTSTDIPDAQYYEIYQLPGGGHELSSGFRLSRCCDELYRKNRVGWAIAYSSIGFCLLHTPFVHLMNGTFHEDWKLTVRLGSSFDKLRSFIGYLHYVVPERICTKRARKIIAVSHSLKEYVAKTYKRRPEDIYVIHNGVDAAFFEQYRGKKLENSSPRCIYVGRLHRNKGILTALDGFSRRKHLDCEFYIFGDGPDRPEIERLASDDPRIHLFGYVSREILLDKIRETNIFVFPSYNEGFGLSLLEAMASGHACVCYDISINRELLGEAGWYAKPFDSEKLLDKIEVCIKNSNMRIELAHKSHAIAQNFGWDKCAQEYISICNHLEEYFQRP